MFKFKAVPDTGAQMVVTVINFLHGLRLSKDNLIDAALKVKEADGSSGQVLRAVFLEISGTMEVGDIRKSLQMVYVVRGVEGLFLSRYC